MTQMGFNLEKLKDVVNEGELAAHPELLSLLTSSAVTAGPLPNGPPPAAPQIHTSQLGVTSTAAPVAPAAPTAPEKKHNNRRNEKTLSCKEIERDRGKPLSKYDRNVMIFDWLHTLDESATTTAVADLT